MADMPPFVRPPRREVDLVPTEVRNDDLVRLVEQSEIDPVVDCPKQRRRQKLARDIGGQMHFRIEIVAQNAQANPAVDPLPGLRQSAE